MMGLGDMAIAFNTACSKVFEQVEESLDGKTMQFSMA